MSEIKLTLNPTPAAEPAAEAAAAPEAIQEPVFTPEEQAQIDEFSKQIDVTDTNLVFSYGANAQQGIAEFSDTALENVKTKDLDEVGDMIANLVTELKASPPTRRRKRASSAGSSIRSARWNCSRPATTRPRSMWTRSAKVWNSIRCSCSRTSPCSTASTSRT